MTDIKIANLKLKFFIPIAIVVLLATYTGTLNHDIVGSFAFLMVIGGILFYIGEIIPIFGSWFGGSVLLPLFGGSALVYFGLVPQQVVKPIQSLMNSGFIVAFIAAALIGSILSLNRKVLLSVAVRMIPCVIVSQIFVIGFLYLASLVVGIKPFRSIFMIGLPNYAGGSPGALAAVPAIYSSVFHRAIGTWSAKFLVFLNISNVICVLFAGILSQIGKKMPQWTGNGNLLKGSATTHAQQAAKTGLHQNAGQLGAGFLLSLVFMIAGNILQRVMPQISYIGWAVIVAILVKVLGVFNDEICTAANEWKAFMMKVFLPILITGIGVASLDFRQLVNYLSPTNIIVLLFAVVGSMLGTLVMALILRLYPIDAMIGIGLQLGTLGASGAITTLQTADRMILMPFAMIANTLGGALMLVEISFLLPLFL